MKPRPSKTSTEARPTNSSLRFEVEYSKTKMAEYVTTIEMQNKHLDALRAKNVEFVKCAEANNVTIKNLNTRILEFSKDCLIANANYARLERKVVDMYNVSLKMRKSFLANSNYLLEFDNIFERNVKGDLTLGRDDPNFPSISNKSPMKAVQPMISGHIIKNPTISISKSDSQHINYLIQHRNDSRHDLNQLNGSNLSDSATNNNIANNSSLQNIINTTNETIHNNLSNGEVYNENNSSEEIENTNESVHYYRRLSTVLELSTLQPTLTNNTNAFSNSVLLETDLSKYSANSTNSSSKSKKRASIMPSPIETSVKVPRGTWHQFSYRNKSNHSSIQNSVSSIGMSTRGSSSGLQSAFTSEDPLEGPSTLLDQENDLVAFSTSTPMDTQRKIGKKSPINAPAVVEHITTRKTKNNLKTSTSTRTNESSEKNNLSKSLNDLSDTDNTIIEITNIKSSVNTKIRKPRKLRSSLFQESPNNNDVEELNNDLLHNDSISKSPTKKVLPAKKGRPARMKTNSKRTVNRKSRSYSPNYRLNNDNSASPEIPLAKREEDFGTIIASSINPIVQLVRLSEPQKAKKKRRSRSLSPQGSDKSDGSEMSTRSSRRTKAIVKYNEPSLKAKIRRK